MKEKFCQSCAMPMTEELFGTEKNGSKNEDYCKYCYENGKFTADVTMDQMIEICVPHMLENNPEMTEEQARNMMNEFLPHLKRWKNK